MQRTPLTLAAAAFLACIVAANAALERWGIVTVLGVTAPAGVLFAGLTFGVRDVVHELGGSRIVLALVAAGAALSYMQSDGATIPGGHASIAVASGAAFALSELADLAVYAPLRERRWLAAVVASNIAGTLIDSALFLWLAFGSLDHIDGQIIGKAAMILPAVILVRYVRRRR